MTVLSCFDGRLPLILAAFVRCASGASDFKPDDFTVVSGRDFSFTVDNLVAHATGRNSHGQLGIGSTEDQLVPAEVQLPDVNDTEVLDIAAGAFHTVFLTNKGAVYVSGWNKHGQLGVGASTGMAQDPTLVTFQDEPDAKAISVAAGYAHSLVVLQSGSVYAFGLNRAGQLGDGSTTSSALPKRISGPSSSQAVAVAAGYDFSYLLFADGTVMSHGQNLGGQLGDGTRKSSSSSVLVKGVSDVKAVVAGESHALFLLGDGSVRGTGANFIGQLGQGMDDAKRMPIAAPVEVAVPGISASDRHERIYAGKDSSCLIAGFTWNLYCMGDNQDGQLGFDTKSSVRAPERVPGVPTDAEGVGLGYSHSLFLVHPGDVYVAGSNAFGELGTNNTEPQLKKVLKNDIMKLSFQDTTPRPPTPAPVAPTPTPPPGTAPSPGTTRSPLSGPDTPTTELVWIWVGAILIGIIALVINVIFQRQGARQMEDEDDVPNQNELELMRNELDA